MKIIFFFVGVIITLIAMQYMPDNRQAGTKFYRVLSLEEYEGNGYNPKHYYESDKSVKDRKMKLHKDVVSKETTAINIAQALYIAHRTDEDDYILRIYVGSAINRIWKVCVVGADSMVVYIQKADGRILRFQKYGK